MLDKNTTIDYELKVKAYKLLEGLRGYSFKDAIKTLKYGIRILKQTRDNTLIETKH